MGGAPRNPAPRNHFLVRIVKPSGWHCTDAFGGKADRRVPTPLRSTSPFSDSCSPPARRGGAPPFLQIETRRRGDETTHYLSASWKLSGRFVYVSVGRASFTFPPFLPNASFTFPTTLSLHFRQRFRQRFRQYVHCASDEQVCPTETIKKLPQHFVLFAPPNKRIRCLQVQVTVISAEPDCPCGQALMPFLETRHSDPSKSGSPEDPHMLPEAH